MIKLIFFISLLLMASVSPARGQKNGGGRSQRGSSNSYSDPASNPNSLSNAISNSYSTPSSNATGAEATNANGAANGAANGSTDGSANINGATTANPALKPTGGPATTAPTSKNASPRAGNNDFKRDPFRLPEYLINKLIAAAAPVIDTTPRIDDSVEPIRRWPLATYVLIGIIWDVKNPKALVADQQRKVHLVRLNDKIGNQGGYVASIREGTIMVMIGKYQEVLKLKK